MGGRRAGRVCRPIRRTRASRRVVARLTGRRCQIGAKAEGAIPRADGHLRRRRRVGRRIEADELDARLSVVRLTRRRRLVAGAAGAAAATACLGRRWQREQILGAIVVGFHAAENVGQRRSALGWLLSTRLAGAGARQSLR